MVKEATILILGANGQVGKELTRKLRDSYGSETVIASDLSEPNSELLKDGPYFQLNVAHKLAIEEMVIRHQVTAIYHLAEIPHGLGEKNAGNTWNINMQGLLNVLDVAKIFQLKVFWPSSIAVFGPTSPKQLCPQWTVTEPTTLYGITKLAGEQLCNYYHEQYGVDVRSLRFPGLISNIGKPAGAANDCGIEFLYQALENRTYNCFLLKETILSMMYMPDAIRAILELMEARPERIKIRTAYNISAMSFCPKQLAEAITAYLPDFRIQFIPGFRQKIANDWPASIDYQEAVKDWGWLPKYDLEAMAADLVQNMVNQNNTYASQLTRHRL
jgi:nucleoside-diphosphate-sugar epimerase